VLASDICRTAYCDAPVRHVDHARPVRDLGETGIDNGVGLCEACNYTKDLPGWQTTLLTRSDGSKFLDLTSPTGHRQRSRAPAPPGAPDPVARRIRALLTVA
jgi:hypothetical protein